MTNPKIIISNKVKFLNDVAEESPPELAQGLSYRHIMLLSLGGAIGAGLFMGSGAAISIAGPSLLLAYAISGLFVFIISRAMGELLVNNLNLKNFSDFATEFIGPWAGYVTGWTYWMNWVLVGIAEITAIGMLFNFWYPDLPQWVPGLIVLSLLVTLNFFNVRYFGETEFWLASIKIVAIIALIVGGSIYILFMADSSENVSFSNVFSHGDFFASGLHGFLMVLPIAVFSFGGIEIVGLMASETKQAGINIPKAINALPVRILVFYIGSIFIIMSLFPWTEVRPNESPFILSFEKIGLQAAASIMTMVVISSLASSCNSGLYATTRMLYTLSLRGNAPVSLSKLNNNRIPAKALGVSFIAMLTGVLLNYLVPDKIFGYLMTGVLVMLLWIWGIIIASHFRYRRKRKFDNLTFRLPLYPVSGLVCAVSIAFLFVLILVSSDTRIAGVVGIIWFSLLTIFWLSKKRHTS
ncbi:MULTISPECIES: amino acid permease [unclassified Brenneria]|uniref:amino acid permease n=1 Tax=unclassified Brenneria TaxID=2634434 RepID=UPI001554F578|nr:amino acid permease [Brenneria sp. hezel4-2-4]MEE3650989.1 amino acid permease [Brenneria sp. HEZEL_4_2_4]NPD00944.1 amino acid permease [Brenneria sp. hezel4-2-4]